MLFARRARPNFRERARIAAWPRRSFGRSFSYYKHRVLRLEASPHAIAAGVAAGAFASCTPLVGFHFLLSFALAWVIGGSMIAAAFGTAVGNPLTFPLIWVTSFQLGELILGPAPDRVAPGDLELSFNLLTQSFGTIWPTLKPMFVGGMVMGAVIGGGLYLLVRSTVMMSQSLRAARLAQAAQNRQDALAMAPSPADIFLPHDYGDADAEPGPADADCAQDRAEPRETELRS
ncbi:DUF2062 domain-containing protein [Acuticoccus yangtzensis]|uniref:DUF2062 domain-containing protein n=1 Tax=Acuticoccus yangtzensis TaxID=1443441 RepID=UPI00094964BE|nr:DUF2062 domain-containing protein [Acuticoccus yangtzensis]ORE94317.1 hypothetical protein ATO13_09591 [Stappia sp. 22II-S9-Z10]